MAIKTKTLSTLSPMQQELEALIRQGLTEGTGPFADIFGGFNQSEFEEGVSKPALKNFQENVLPALQEKFIAGGQVGGSGQERAFGKAGSDFAAHMAELLYNAKQQQKANKIQGVNTAYGKQTVENIAQPESLLNKILPAAGAVVGATGGGFAGASGGPAGIVTGALKGGALGAQTGAAIAG
jgi:hypothetical protein